MLSLPLTFYSNLRYLNMTLSSKFSWICVSLSYFLHHDHETNFEWYLTHKFGNFMKVIWYISLVMFMLHFAFMLGCWLCFHSTQVCFYLIRGWMIPRRRYCNTPHVKKLGKWNFFKIFDTRLKYEPIYDSWIEPWVIQRSRTRDLKVCEKLFSLESLHKGLYGSYIGIQPVN